MSVISSTLSEISWRVFVILFILTAILVGIVKREENKVLNKQVQNQVVMQDLENAVYDDSVKYDNIKSVLEAFEPIFGVELKILDD